MSESPIGGLMLDADKRAKGKASKAHTSESPCGCRVSTSWFSEDSRTNKFEPCSEHADRKARR